MQMAEPQGKGEIIYVFILPKPCCSFINLKNRRKHPFFYMLSSSLMIYSFVGYDFKICHICLTNYIFSKFVPKGSLLLSSV